MIFYYAIFSSKAFVGDSLKQMNFRSRKFYRRVIQLFGRHFYLNPDSDLRNSILVAGTARSGTTWLGDLIASQIPCRTMFEPFNPELVPEYRGFHYFQYLRPGSKNHEFHSFARKIFSGEIRNRWIDHQNEQIFPKYRLIKEVRVNLALKWLHDNFPEVPIVFLLRHPCAVVLSRMELGWATDTDIEPFLSQPDLVTDFLSEHQEFIRNAKTKEEKHAIIWSISTMVPLRQLKQSELKIVYYENLCTQPEMELPSIFAFTGHQYSPSAFDTISRPSQTTQKTSPIVSGTDKVSHWRKKLNPAQVENILRVVERFGLDKLYGDSLLPLNKIVA